MPGEWVEIRNCAWLHEAQLLRSVLADEGIESFIPGERALDVQPFHFPAQGGVPLLVRPGDVERANKVLASAAVDGDRDGGA